MLVGMTRVRVGVAENLRSVVGKIYNMKLTEKEQA
jgi:hypothetical protein